MSGCSEETNRSSPVSVGPNENAGGEKLNIGIDTLKEIGDGLYYDVNTNIVCWSMVFLLGIPVQPLLHIMLQIDCHINIIQKRMY